MTSPPHECPACGARLALRVWVRGELTSGIAASLTTTDPGDHIGVRRLCNACDWGDRRELVVRAVQDGADPTDDHDVWDGPDEGKSPSPEGVSEQQAD